MRRWQKEDLNMPSKLNRNIKHRKRLEKSLWNKTRTAVCEREHATTSTRLGPKLIVMKRPKCLAVLFRKTQYHLQLKIKREHLLDRSEFDGWPYKKMQSTLDNHNSWSSCNNDNSSSNNNKKAAKTTTATTTMSWQISFKRGRPSFHTTLRKRGWGRRHC